MRKSMEGPRPGRAGGQSPSCTPAPARDPVWAGSRPGVRRRASPYQACPHALALPARRGLASVARLFRKAAAVSMDEGPGCAGVQAFPTRPRTPARRAGFLCEASALGLAQN